LYEIFTGRLPFQGSSAAGIIQAYLNSDPVKPSSFVRGFNSDLEKVILKAIERNPSSRFQTASDLLTALELAETSILEPRGKGDDLDSTFGDPKQSSETRLKELFEKGKELYDQLRLEDAIQAWKEALAINPSDNVVQKCVSSAESRLTKENQLKKELNALLIQGEKHLTTNRLDDLRDVIAQCEKLLTPSRRFLELRERVNALRKDLETQEKRTRR
jgi:tetratricopeptide (TPR) repeat protein